ncbi:MAG: hypothetical protein LLG93_13170, partial [Deltaproteobacteria bacterium]|nr:hypothetical protein [Deltaproteobacteria bacterium]
SHNPRNVNASARYSGRNTYLKSVRTARPATGLRMIYTSRDEKAALFCNMILKGGMTSSLQAAQAGPVLSTFWTEKKLDNSYYSYI